MTMVDPNVRRNFTALVSAAFVDGILSEAEKLVLHRKATEMNIPLREMNELLALGEQGRLTVTVPPDRQQREFLLDQLIDIAGADDRLEAPEYHLLAKFAAHLGMGLPELRARVRRRLDQRRGTPPPPPSPRLEVTRSPLSIEIPPPPPPPPPPGSPIPDIPPVTLQLIKQALLFESPQNALQYIERLMGLTRPEAQTLMARILETFPDLKPGSRRIP